MARYPYWTKVLAAAVVIFISLCSACYAALALLGQALAYLGDERFVEVVFFTGPVVALIVASIYAADVLLRTRPIARLFNVELCDDCSSKSKNGENEQNG